jgi:phosphate transport system substrate-binding protein
MSVRMMLKARFAAAFTGVALLAPMMTAHGAHSLDANLPAYRPVDALSGHLKSVGSDTLGHETEAWAKGFEKLYPDVKVDIEAVG